MSIQLNPYINFNGNTRQVMEYYKDIFGGTLNISTFKEYNASRDPSDDNKIMHAQLEGNDGITIMAADIPFGMEFTPGSNYSLSLSGTEESHLTQYFRMLSEGGIITQPLVKATWGDTFGMVTDRFGVNWMVNITQKQE